MPPDLLLDLTRRYTEPHRHYHGIEHIAHMLAVGAPVGIDEVQVMAIWFHDAVYDPTRNDNEEASAQLAERLLADGGWAPTDVAAVASIVRDTATHTPTSARAGLVIDLDLMGLAAPDPIFDRNSANIRREYDHIPDAEFGAGTVAFVDAFLARPSIYHTAWGKPLEALARANLARLRARWND